MPLQWGRLYDMPLWVKGAVVASFIQSGYTHRCIWSGGDTRPDMG